MENNEVKVVLKKQWYKKNGEVKVGFTPAIQTIGNTILLKVVMKRDFYKLQELAEKGVISVEEVNTKETAKEVK